MEQKPSCHSEVHSQTVSSPFQLKRSPSEFSLGEALEYLLNKSMRSEKAADTQGYQDGKVGEFRVKYQNFASTNVFFGDVCAGDLSFAFKNRLAIQHRLLNRLAEITKQEEPTVVPENNRMRMVSR